MKISLICPENSRRVVSELLRSRGFEIGGGAEISFVIRAPGDPGSGVEVLFSMNDLDVLLGFLDNGGTAPAGSGGSVLAGRKDGRFQPLEPGEIYYFQADGNTVYGVTETSRYEIRKKLFEIEADTAFKSFVRINKSFIVNIRQVGEIIPWFGGRLLIKLKKRKEELEVSRVFVGSFKAFIGL